ncbi:Mitochondrial glycoprotein [Quillaja saponaria]|uniref:Mitochondrial glycoprotein n=1 Tax=Quillaja saponaria TaxID=32244 RepID=A0AAD7PN12_QUISA|nr:Mitochondrial glycoprotein [Quillaja saponaria]
MWKKVLVGAAGIAATLRHPCHLIETRHSSTSISSAVNSMLLRSLKEHYLEIAKMTFPPKVDPPSPFTIVKGALDSNSPVLKRMYGDEEISIYVMRLANIVPGGGDDDDNNGIDQLFLHVDVSKPGQKDSLNFLCGLYEDAIGIHSVSMRTKFETSGYLVTPSQYNGPVFEDLDERMRDAFHNYIDERGVNESLFKFLQAWLYVKDHRHLMRWFKTVGVFVDGKKPAKDA